MVIGTCTSCLLQGASGILRGEDPEESESGLIGIFWYYIRPHNSIITAVFHTTHELELLEYTTMKLWRLEIGDLPSG